MQNYVGKQIDRYRITERLGMGGMAVVYKAYDTRLERDVALKLIRTESIPQDQHDRLFKRFEREAKAQARFSHRNIVPVHDYGEVDGSPYLVMAFISGGTLKDRLQGPVDWRQAVRWLIPVAEALAYAHQRGIVHRDVKPANILFDEEDQPILTDFGIAKVLETDEATLTGTGLGVGTPEYMAPEQWQGETSAATDQYALSVVLYELITGKKPYSADTPAAIILMQATEPLRAPSKLVKGIPEVVENLLYKSMAINPTDRYEDMQAFRNALEDVLIKSDKPESAPYAAPSPAPAKPYDSDSETYDALSATPVERFPQSPANNKLEKQGIPKWALWVTIGIIIIGLVIGIGSNLSNPGQRGVSPMALLTETTTSPTKEVIATEKVIPSAIDCMQTKPGDKLTMLYQWSGVEEEYLIKVLTPFVDACGIVINPTSTRDQTLLDNRVLAGTPPDIAFWNVTQLTQYKDQLVPMTDLGVHAENYADFWKNIGTVDGKWLGLPVKADLKTLVWYSPANFAANGYTVPTTWDELVALADQMVADGVIPWSMGFESGDATGWTGTDFVQDILLVKQGPDYINGIISGTVPYNDPGVKEAWEIYGNWAMDDQYTIGGAAGTVSISFIDAILKVFSTPPEAMMIKQSGFTSGVILETYPDLVLGEGYSIFGVPSAKGLQGGSDWMMSFSDSNAVKALVAYLSSTMGGVRWAQVGFDLTPNITGSTSYTDPALLKKAEILANTQGFTPDLGDFIPGGFGVAEFSGITEYINGGDLDSILDNLAQTQADSLAE